MQICTDISSPLSNGEHEQVDEPHEGVLVHGVYVWEIADGKEENASMASYWAVACPGLVDLLFCLIRNLDTGLGSQHTTSSLIKPNIF